MSLRSNQIGLQSLTRALAHRCFLPEAIQFLEHQRPSVLSVFQSYRLAIVNREIGPDNAIRLRKDLDPKEDSFSNAELIALKKNDAAVDVIVKTIVKGVERRMRMNRNRYEEELEELDESDQQQIKRAIYHLGTLMCHFHFSGFKGVSKKNVEEGRKSHEWVKWMSTHPERFNWSYDYSFAASLNTEDLFAVLGLARPAFVMDLEWEGFEMLYCDNPSRATERPAYGFIDASLKRFAFVNLFETCRILETKPVHWNPTMITTIEDVFDCAFNEAWYVPNSSIWRKCIERLDSLRKDPRVGFTTKGYNPRVFFKSKVKLARGAEPKTLQERDFILVKTDGWEKVLNKKEKEFMWRHEAEKWFGDEIHGSPPLSDMDYDELCEYARHLHEDDEW